MRKPVKIKKPLASLAAKVSKLKPAVNKQRPAGSAAPARLRVRSTAKSKGVKVTIPKSPLPLTKRIRKPVVTRKKKLVTGNVVLVKKDKVGPRVKVAAPAVVETIKSVPGIKLKQKDSGISKSKKTGRSKSKDEENSTKKKLEKNKKKARKLKKEIKKTKKKKDQKKKLKSIKKEFAKVLKRLKNNRKKLKKDKK